MARKPPDAAEIIKNPETRMFWEDTLNLRYPEDPMTSPRLNDPDLQEAFRRGKEHGKANSRAKFHSKAGRRPAADSEWIRVTAERQSGMPSHIPTRMHQQGAGLSQMWMAGSEFGKLEAKYGLQGAIERKIKDYWRPLTRQEYKEQGREPLWPPYADEDPLTRFGRYVDYWVDGAKAGLRNSARGLMGRASKSARYRTGGDEAGVALLSDQAVRSTASLQSRSSGTLSRDATHRPASSWSATGTTAVAPHGLTTSSATSLLPPSERGHGTPSTPPATAPPAVHRAAPGQARRGPSR